ncbi:cytidine deaminase [Bifidobacterium sp. 82T24]|uniref:cytidine deaminase n=1 Tax=Bifidobacterium pluvialisilvae TaxID=2834436 RepID=UPI0035576295|nr:cytidine deaminase [Bifidobacterium pluvialisilvae]
MDTIRTASQRFAKEHDMSTISTEELITKAIEARERSYSPYSHFCVGAALEATDGTVYTGCIIENMGFAPTICAERTACAKAVSEGHHEFTRIVVVGGAKGPLTSFCSPCGMCREFLCEFCERDFEIILAKSPTEYKSYTLDELYPLTEKPVFDTDDPFGGAFGGK